MQLITIHGDSDPFQSWRVQLSSERLYFFELESCLVFGVVASAKKKSELLIVSYTSGRRGGTQPDG